jgi:hypothetical protein
MPVYPRAIPSLHCLYTILSPTGRQKDLVRHYFSVATNFSQDCHHYKRLLVIVSQHIPSFQPFIPLACHAVEIKA